nr:MFS transporter [Nocardia farcinica]
MRLARVAVFTVFGVNGFLLAMWVVHIPAVTDRTGVSHSELGMFILLMAGAAIAGIRLAGPMADRFGSRTQAGAAAVTASVAVIGPGLATGPVQLGIALACFGFANGALDMSMNAQAVQVERAYGRPILAAFHALFSGGGLLGSLLGAGALRLGLDLRLTLLLTCLAGLALTALWVPRMLPDAHQDVHATVPGAEVSAPGGDPGATVSLDDPAVRTGSGRTPRADLGEPSADDPRAGHGRKVLALAVIAFAVLLTEGVAADWSTLQMRDRLGVDDATAALAFAAFSITMTGGRLVADRVSGAIGPVAVVRHGMLLAALGLTFIVVSPWTPLTLTGWALCGLGLSGSIPQIFTAAGNLGSTTAATDMSRVFALGYLGLLAGPALIGGLTELVSLTTALVVPLVAVVVCALSAGVVTPRANRDVRAPTR